jgi:hypothetical protein
MATYRGQATRIPARRAGAGDSRNELLERTGGYRWRDPRRVGPARLAQLQAHDRKMAALLNHKPPKQEDTDEQA